MPDDTEGTPGNVPTNGKNPSGSKPRKNSLEKTAASSLSSEEANGKPANRVSASCNSSLNASIIRAVGESVERIIKGCVHGMALLLLIGGGLLMSFYNPEEARGVWLVMGPIVGYLVGKHSEVLKK